MTRTTLLERGPQLDELAARFADAAGGSGQVILLGGEAGSGKTSLIGAFIETLPKAVMVRSASCDAAGIQGPLGPILDIAGTFGPQVGEAVEHDTGIAGIARLMLGELRNARVPSLLVAEDVHWADQATLDLLRFLARRLDGTHTLLIATFRDDSLAPVHELHSLLGDLASQPNVAQMSLPPLSFAAVEAMASGAGLDPAALFESTGGNPFYVSEIVNSKSEQIPRSIREVILARAAPLDPDSRRVVEFAAVAGPSLDLHLLRSVGGRDIAVEIERGMHVGLLRSTPNGIDFRHAITRDVILGEMSTLRRSDIASQILECLESARNRSATSAMLAHFAEEAMAAKPARTYAIAAAKEAARLGAHRQSILQYDRALRFSVDCSGAEVASLLEARSFEHHITSQNEAAISDISSAIELRRQLGDSRAEGDDLRRRSRYYWIAGRNTEAESDALAALALLDDLDPSVELAMACSNLAQLHMLSRRTSEAIAWGNRAIELASILEAPHVLLHAKTNVGSALVLNEVGNGWTMLEEAEQLARNLDLHDDVGRTYSNRAFMALDLHQLPRAIDLAGAGIAYTEEHDNFSMGHYLHALLATAQIEAGDLISPEQELIRLLEIPNLIVPTRIVALTSLGLLRGRLGEDGKALLDEALALANKTGEFQRIGPVRSARAEAAWLANDPASALGEARAGLDHSVNAGSRWSNGRLALWMHRAGGRIDSGIPMAEPYLLEIEGSFASAAALWSALGFPLQEARALAAQGTIDGLRAALDKLLSIGARADVARVTKQLRLLGETNIPKGPQVRTRAHPAHLTNRELEVLRLLSRGKSNREIAETLFISPRTCGAHVEAIFTKLGVHSRVEAAARAAELGVK